MNSFESPPPAPPAAHTCLPAETPFESLHPNARWFMRLGSMMVFGQLLGGSAVGIAFGLDSVLDVPVMQTLPWLLGAVLLALPLGWWFGGLRFVRTRYRLDPSGLEIHRGVLWRTRSRIPRSRVQHTDIDSGPLDRRLGLATLKVFTAGTRMASVDIDGLPAARAVELRDALLDAHDDTL
jgi:uncharacterized protein